MPWMMSRLDARGGFDAENESEFDTEADQMADNAEEEDDVAVERI